jgi:hypothetical protein
MIKSISKLLYKLPMKSRWITFVVSSFVSIISFFNISSAWADKANANSALVIIGVVAGLIAIAFFAVAAKESDDQSGKRR